MAPWLTIATPNYQRPDLLARTARSFVQEYGGPEAGGYRWILIDDGSDAATVATINELQTELGCWSAIIHAPHGEAVQRAFAHLYNPAVATPYVCYMESDYEWDRGGWLDFARDVLEQCPSVGEVLAENLPVLADNEGEFFMAEHLRLRSGQFVQVNTCRGPYRNRFGQFSMRVHMARADLFDCVATFPRVDNRQMEKWLGHQFNRYGWKVALPDSSYATHIGRGCPAVPYANMGGIR